MAASTRSRPGRAATIRNDRPVQLWHERRNAAALSRDRRAVPNCSISPQAAATKPGTAAPRSVVAPARRVLHRTHLAKQAQAAARGTLARTDGAAEHLRAEPLLGRGDVVVDVELDEHGHWKSCPGRGLLRAASSSIRARLTWMRSGVAELSSVVGDLLEAEHLLAERGQDTGSRRRPASPSEADAVMATALGGACVMIGLAATSSAREQPADLGDVLIITGDRAVGQADEAAEVRSRHPVRGRGRNPPRTAERAWLPGPARLSGSTPRAPDDGNLLLSEALGDESGRDVERVWNSPGRGSQALESPAVLRHAQLLHWVEWKAEPGVQLNADHHDREYAGMPGVALSLAPAAGRTPSTRQLPGATWRYHGSGRAVIDLVCCTEGGEIVAEATIDPALAGISSIRADLGIISAWSAQRSGSSRAYRRRADLDLPGAA